jgi:hypothetical protein
MTNKLTVRVFKQVSDEMIIRSWGHKLLQYQIIICIPSRTMSSDNSNNYDKNNDNNHGVPSTSRDRLGGKGSFYDNDNYTDHHQCENRLTSLVPRMNKRQERMRAEKRVRDLEYDLRQLEADNKRLKVELKFVKKKYRRLSKEDIRTCNEWTFYKANLSNKQQLQQGCHVCALQVFEGGMAGLQTK